MTAAYLAVLLFAVPDFRVVVVHTSLASAVLLAGFLAASRRRKRAGRLGAAGAAVVLAAGVVQTLQIGVAALGLSHNALYHVVMGLALYLVFRGAPAALPAAASEEPAQSRRV